MIKGIIWSLLECSSRRAAPLHDDLVAHLFAVKGLASNQARKDRVFGVYRGQKNRENLVKASWGEAPESIGRELPTTHRVVIYAMVITAAAGAAACKPITIAVAILRVCLSSPSLSRARLLVSPSYVFLHTLVLCPDDKRSIHPVPIDLARFSLVPIYPLWQKRWLDT